jgi:hypothetical protein
MADPARINQVVAAWVREHGVERCIKDSKEKGGWEGEVQSLLVPFFMQHIPCTVAQREVTNVLQGHSSLAVDFVCETGLNKNPPFFIIELKCQSTFQDSVKPTKFAERLQGDVTKLQSALEPGFQGGEKWVIGICCNQDIAKATADYGFVPNDCMNCIPVEEGNDVVNVFWARFTT